MPSIVFNSASNGSFVLTDDFTNTPQGVITLTRGTLDTGSHDVTCRVFTSTGNSTRALMLGSSNITIAGNGINAGWNTTAALTLDAGTSTITLTGTTAELRAATNHTYHNVVMTGLTATTLQGELICNSFARYHDDSTNARLTLYGNITANSITLEGFSEARRLYINSDTPGVSRTITATNATINYVDFADITATGDSAPWTGTLLGNCAGNSGITFPTPVTRYRVGDTYSDFSNTAYWSTSSGGPGGASMPLPQDTAIFDANSAPSGISRVASMDIQNIPEINCTGYTGRLTNVARNYWGSITLSPTMTFSHTGGSIILAGRGSHTITTAGVTPTTGTYAIQAVGGMYELLDNFTGGSIAHNYGGFKSNSHIITLSGNYISPAPTIRTLDLGTSTLNFTTTSAASIIVVSPPSMTQNMSNTTINIVNPSSLTREIVANNSYWGHINYTVANSTGTLYLRGANQQFRSITASDSGNKRLIQFQSGTTVTFHDFVNLTGNASYRTVLDSSSAGATAGISMPSGVVSNDYLEIRDIVASGNTRWYAGENSIDLGNNTGWIFTDPPPTHNFFFGS
jgi:hypothetical protein